MLQAVVGEDDIRAPGHQRARAGDAIPGDDGGTGAAARDDERLIADLPPVASRLHGARCGAAAAVTARDDAHLQSLLEQLAREPDGERGLAGATDGEIADHHHRSEEHTSELQSQSNLVCRLLLEKKTMLFNPPAKLLNPLSVDSLPKAQAFNPLA